MRWDPSSSLSFTGSLIHFSRLGALLPSIPSDIHQRVGADLFPWLEAENVPVQINEQFSKRALSLRPAHTVPEIPLA